MPFHQGQHVRMLVVCEGEGDDEQEHTYPPGTAGVIDLVERDRRIYHVAVGAGDAAITVCFDFGAEAEAGMEPLPAFPKVTAVPVAYSSVVGAGVMLCNPDGAVIVQLALLNCHGGRAEQEAIRDRIVAAINNGQAEGRVEHKNGGTYDVLPEALFQVSKQGGLGEPGPGKVRLVRDGDPVRIYRNTEGKLFVRFADEMVPPRFKEIQS